MSLAFFAYVVGCGCDVVDKHLGRLGKRQKSLLVDLGVPLVVAFVNLSLVPFHNAFDECFGQVCIRLRHRSEMRAGGVLACVLSARSQTKCKFRCERWQRRTSQAEMAGSGS